MDLPITGPRMTKIREYNLANLVWLRHLFRIFTGLNDEFKPPKAVLVLAKSAADCWPTGVAEEAKILWEEQVVHLFRRIPHLP
jgi:hypothetical protein